MKCIYPVLAGEIDKRGIKKSVIANVMGITERAFYNKLSGSVSFKWEEACCLQARFFPDLDKDYLLKKGDVR